MKLSRDVAARIRFVLDECLPPILRDARWFVRPALRLVFGPKAAIFLDFKQRAMTMSDDELAHVYRDIQGHIIERDTDLNEACAEAILRDAVGRVLEVGCGRGWLAARLAEAHPTTAVDLALDRDAVARHPRIRWATASVERLPFADGAFDTVVCAHTLEHVKNVPVALAELRRVARRRLIVVVPRQRPYRYTFDLHLSFFPYRHSFLAVVGPERDGRLEDLGGDWYYVEEIPARKG